LPKETVAEVRELVAHYRAANGPLAMPTANGTPLKQKAKAMPRTAQVSIKAANVPKLSLITSVHAGEAKVMSERVYPRLYLFENSLRDVIERVLNDAHGPGWWPTVPKRVQQKAAEHKAAEGRDAWHGKRGSRDFDYTFLTQLWDIVKDQWKLFKHLFPS